MILKLEGVYSIWIQLQFNSTDWLFGRLIGPFLAKFVMAFMQAPQGAGFPW